MKSLGATISSEKIFSKEVSDMTLATLLALAAILTPFLACFFYKKRQLRIQTESRDQVTQTNEKQKKGDFEKQIDFDCESD